MTMRSLFVWIAIVFVLSELSYIDAVVPNTMEVQNLDSLDPEKQPPATISNGSVSVIANGTVFLSLPKSNLLAFKINASDCVRGRYQFCFPKKEGSHLFHGLCDPSECEVDFVVHNVPGQTPSVSFSAPTLRQQHLAPNVNRLDVYRGLLQWKDVAGKHMQATFCTLETRENGDRWHTYVRALSHSHDCPITIVDARLAVLDDAEDKSTVPLWVIVVASVFGVVAVFIFILILCWCCVFRHKWSQSQTIAVSQQTVEVANKIEQLYLNSDDPAPCDTEWKLFQAGSVSALYSSIRSTLPSLDKSLRSMGINVASTGSIPVSYRTRQKVLRSNTMLRNRLFMLEFPDKYPLAVQQEQVDIICSYLSIPDLYTALFADDLDHFTGEKYLNEVLHKFQLLYKRDKLAEGRHPIPMLCTMRMSPEYRWIFRRPL